MAMATHPGSPASSLSHSANSVTALPVCAKERSATIRRSWSRTHAWCALHSPSRYQRRTDNRYPPLHLLFLSAADDASSPLYWRSRRNSPLEVHQPPASLGRKSSLGARSARGNLALPARRSCLIIPHFTHRKNKEGVVHRVHRLRDRSKIPPVDLWATHLKILDQCCGWTSG